MVQLNKMVGTEKEVRHNLTPNFDDPNFPKDGMWCLIQHMSHGKYEVTNYSKKVDGNFCRVFDTVDEVHANFEEIPLK